jgi:beta-fructofuranosidase
MTPTKFDGLIAALALLISIVPASAALSAEPPLTNKTLVVWTALANLNQRGGSALTLDDGRSHFDGIVFGELAPQRWMAGSDLWHRTNKQQGDWPQEKADAGTTVQVAIVYQDKHVAIYRDGRKYAEYDTAAAFPFPHDSHVVMGVRHLQAAGDSYAGYIADARVYDVALSVEQLSALRPNEPSEPKPWAWWTFEDKEAIDRTGRFKFTRLMGTAKVEEGHLILDGHGTLLAATTEAALSQLARPTTTTAPLRANAADVTRAHREYLLADPHRPGYHFAVPEGRAIPFDPNGAIYWKGRYHLFYIFQDKRGHNWGHVSSTDLFHWRFHPTGLVDGMFSGNCFINKDGRPTMCYHQVDQGNAMAVAVDDELNEWRKLPSNPITPETKPGDEHHGRYRSWDPFGWLEGDTYYAIFGGQRPAIAKCKTLGGDWKYVGDLMAGPVKGVSINEDVSCAELFKLGNKHMLLCISHQLGARYYLGEWKNEQFHPDSHHRMSWIDNSFFAPESLLDNRGRRIMWAWIFDRPEFGTRMKFGWSGTMSLPRVLSLSDDGTLRMKVPAEIERLRYNARQKERLTVKANAELPLSTIHGNSIELTIEMTGSDARQFGVKVCCSPDGEEQTVIYYDVADQRLKVDTTRSSRTEGPKSIESAPFELKPNQPLRLRVFVDKSVVEVFVNDRQAVMRRIYPTRADSVGVRLFSNGGSVNVTKLKAWDIMPSNPY